MKKTYKEQFIEKITKEILLYDKETNNYNISPIARNYYCERAKELREIRKKAKELNVKHFIPCRFPSAEFLSLCLSLRKELIT